MILSKATGYGIRALAFLANRPKLCGLQEIAEYENIPPVYLQKVLGELRRRRLLRSVKGINGGYELARPAEEITLWEIFRLLESDPDLDTCILGRGLCSPESTCPLHEDWQKVRQEFVFLMQRKTISDVAASTRASKTVAFNTPEPSNSLDCSSLDKSQEESGRGNLKIQEQA